jgi:hypothetical protein
LNRWSWLLLALLVVVGCSKSQDSPHKVVIPPDRLPPKKS